LTADNKRWSGKAAVWQDGWRNLHTSGTTTISVEFAAAGRSRATRVVRTWAADAKVADGTAYVQRHGQSRQPVDALAWDRALEVYRPYLSYSELGTLVDRKPPWALERPGHAHSLSERAACSTPAQARVFFLLGGAPPQSRPGAVQPGGGAAPIRRRGLG
jgi:hypothetical protein